MKTVRLPSDIYSYSSEKRIVFGVSNTTHSVIEQTSTDINDQSSVLCVCTCIHHMYHYTAFSNTDTASYKPTSAVMSLRGHSRSLTMVPTDTPSGDL